MAKTPPTSGPGRPRARRTPPRKDPAVPPPQAGAAAPPAHEDAAAARAGRAFDPSNLDRSVIALPLLMEMEDAPGAIHNVIIDVDLSFPGGRDKARGMLRAWIDELTAASTDEGINRAKSEYSQQYIFGRLGTQTIKALVRKAKEQAEAAVQRDAANRDARLAEGVRPPQEGDTGRRSALHRIWLDHKVRRFVFRSVSTVKADAARNAFGARGSDIVWAVIDTGIDGTHPHFRKHRNLILDEPLRHRDFTQAGQAGEDELARLALVDRAGHGTHVAGIIAGEIDAAGEPGRPPPQIWATVRERDEEGEVSARPMRFPAVSGMAPQCQLLSLKVLDDEGEGLASNLIAALEYIQELNGNGRRLRVHGVNMSVGYDFEPKWFACGQSPLCVEVNRLVQSGVVVVVAAGNTGYGFQQSEARGSVPAGLDLTINDPGNAELAITVGATHRDMPHVYGVSYFSSKGPTGDGRLKPDLVAPGEKILSCQSSQMQLPAREAEAVRRVQDGMADPAGGPVALYREDSGTSMAAPHVSGVIAAFLSSRREFIGQPTRVKDIFLSTATDLRRLVYFQGRGLVDLMRAIQSV